MQLQKQIADSVSKLNETMSKILQEFSPLQLTGRLQQNLAQCPAGPDPKGTVAVPSRRPFIYMYTYTVFRFHINVQGLFPRSWMPIFPMQFSKIRSPASSWEPRVFGKCPQSGATWKSSPGSLSLLHCSASTRIAHESGHEKWLAN